MTDDENPLQRARDPSHPEGPGEDDSGHPVSGTLRSLRYQLDHLERLLGPEVRLAEGVPRRLEPAWRRATEAEGRLAVSATILVAIGLQLGLPARFEIRPTWLLPALEGVLMVGLLAANPRRTTRTSPLLRTGSLALIAIISAANAWSVAELVHGIITASQGTSSAPTLIGSGAAIYLTNVIVFGLWYWEFDRGGPIARARGAGRYPDFLFVQMTQSDVASPDWTPAFFDYLWLSFTNATAFSPTDTMPLSRPAKAIMMVQAAVSLLTVGLVIARAVNIFR
ncbi:MAG: hypothetical protein J2O39_03585 [Acidimicrobiales bacterium]|nr:hypothetical protein [Acidimicrobiales bacterium]MBO0893437.1 hypothetical protein [Acidimicrobiales bacterium]